MSRGEIERPVPPCRDLHVGELVAVDGPTGAGAGAGVILRKSPPWQMKLGMMRWKMERLKESG